MDKINNTDKEFPYTGNPHDTRRVYTDEEVKKLYKLPDLYWLDFALSDL